MCPCLSHIPSCLASANGLKWSDSSVCVHAGSVEDVGVGDGKHYSVNVPLQEGMDDESYRFMFEPIMQKVWVYGNPVQGATQDCAYLTLGEDCTSYHIHICTHMYI